MEMKFTFLRIPQNVDELKTFPEYALDTPAKTAALTLIVLCRYAEDASATIAMLNALKGPEAVSEYEKQFLKDRLAGKEYKPHSFFKGATPANNYTPESPYEVTISDNPYSYPEENWATMHIKSSGADSLRQIKLRKKPSEGKWYLNDIQCLSDIREPVSADQWA